MLPYIHHRKFTFDDNFQQLQQKPQQPSFFLQNNEKRYTPMNQKDNKSQERKDSVLKTRSQRVKSEANSPKNSITPQPNLQPQPGPGYYSIKYDLIQQKAPTAKIYTEPSTINTNETLSKYLTTELINKKMLQRRKTIVDGPNLSPGPAKYMNENYPQRNSISYKFPQSRRDDLLFSGQHQQNPFNYINELPLLEFVEPRFGNGVKQGLKGQTLCDLDINSMFTKQDLTLITIPNTQKHYKGRSFSKSPKKLSPRFIDEDLYYDENNFDDIPNENPGPGYYEIQGHFDTKLKRNEQSKQFKPNKPVQPEKRQKVLLRPLQPPRQIYSPTKAHRQEFNTYMQELKQSCKQSPVSQTPQPLSNQEYQISPNNANSSSKTYKYNNFQQKQFDNGNNQSQQNHFLFPHDFIKYEEQININH